MRPVACACKTVVEEKSSKRKHRMEAGKYVVDLRGQHGWSNTFAGNFSIMDSPDEL
jgi:hypothetical protein